MSNERDDGIDVDALAVRAFNAGMYEPDCQGPDEDEESDVVYCGFPMCENKAIEQVPVSNNAGHVEMRPVCYDCSEAYYTGAQYGRFRAYRQLMERAKQSIQFSVENTYTVECAEYVRDSVDDPALESESEGDSDG